jgi:hypothetical protein
METTEKQPQPMLKYAATYALVLGLIFVLLAAIDYVFKFYGFNSFLSLLNNLALIIGIIAFTLMYRNKALDGYISYGQALGFGVLLAMFTYFIAGVFAFLIHIFDPAYIEKQLEMTADIYAQNGFSDEMIEQSIKMMRIIKSPVMTLLTTLFGGVFFGTIISLVTSIFIKKNKSIF